ncbi:hypothetical protein WICMUC_002917 [Wickerhamomyces mucosus]|uniref:LIM zinc-binding domain-containing protein n=1 Tax=Wickerhamomyces mucosus TaxID=1378264 RepID=A0A9P8PP39_9ASCO|nr:hypothetical protein WICMUC_002917 [Wickerhamomyces mucosus]
MVSSIDPPKQRKKPSYFKTLPDNFTNPSSSVKYISNSRFPTIDPNKRIKTVYELAGFDVYKPNKSKTSNNTSIHNPLFPKPGILHGQRSHSTSNLLKESPAKKHFNQKRNLSEYHLKGENNDYNGNEGFKSQELNNNNNNSIPSPRNIKITKSSLKSQHSRNSSDFKSLNEPIKETEEESIYDSTSFNNSNRSSSISLITNNNSIKEVLPISYESSNSTSFENFQQSTNSIKKNIYDPIDSTDIMNYNQNLNESSIDDEINYQSNEGIETKINELLPENQHLDFNSIKDLNEDEIPIQLNSSPSKIPDIKINDEDLMTPQLQEEERFRNSISSQYSEYSPDRRSNILTPITSSFDQTPGYNNDDNIPIERPISTQSFNNNEEFQEVERHLNNLTLSSNNRLEKMLDSLTSPDLYIDKDDNEFESPLEIKKHYVKNSNSIESQEEKDSLSNKQNDYQLTKKLSNLNQNQSIVFPPGQGPCRNCNLSILTKPIYSKSGELSGQWHKECFKCTTCSQNFNKNISCFVLNDLPYCEIHYHITNNSLCKVCGHGIIGECLENDFGDRYHINCLKCIQCQQLIKGDSYLSINENIYCEPCAIKFTSINDGENNNIERRKTRLYFL